MLKLDENRIIKLFEMIDIGQHIGADQVTDSIADKTQQAADQSRERGDGNRLLQGLGMPCFEVEKNECGSQQRTCTDHQHTDTG